MEVISSCLHRNELQVWGRTRTAGSYKPYSSGITPCLWLSQMFLQLLFPTVMAITLEKAENTKWRMRDPVCRDFHHPRPGLLPQLIDVLHPREPPGPQNLVSPGVPLQDVTSLPCGRQSLQRDAAFTHAKPNSDFSGSLSPVHGLYFSLKKILSLKPAEINAVAAQINFTSTCYFF